MSDAITRRIIREAREIVASSRICPSCGCKQKSKVHKPDCWVSEWQRRANEWEVAESLYQNFPAIMRRREDETNCVCSEINSRHCQVHGS